MMNNLDWNGFCEQYFDTAKRYASIHLRRMKEKQGAFDRRVDEDYVMDAAVLAALEKTYTHFDSSRGAKITTYLSNLVHNELVDEVRKESRQAAVQDNLDDVKAYVRTLSAGGADGPSTEAIEQLIPLLKSAIERLSPSDQVILNYYLEDKSSYITKATETLHVERNYVSLRCHRIMKLLPKLMGMSRNDYLNFCDEHEITVFANNIPRCIVFPSNRSSVDYLPVTNIILPSLDTLALARKLSESL